MAEPGPITSLGVSRRALLGGTAVLAAIAGEALAPAETASAAAPAAATVRAVSTAAPQVVTGTQHKTYTEAAKAAHPLKLGLFTPTDHHSHLLRRATFGARPSDVADLTKYGINGWLKRQFAPSTIADPDGQAAWKAFPLAGASPATVMKEVQEYAWDAMFATAQATLAVQIFSKRQLYEITADIFAAHLHVAVPGEQWQTSPGYITSVIRAHAFGTFEGMLQAAMKHPAMLDFLSNDQSEKAHVNENLGRELLELHTVGTASGFTEADVKASAAILSGRKMDYDKGTYLYDPTEHVTGPVRVLGFSSPNATGKGGEAVGDAYLHYLAHHPSTATNIARKIATRFVSDTPSNDLVKRLAHVYLTSGTSILATVKAVFLSSDFWSAVGVRMRRPLEDAVGAARVLDVRRGATAAATNTGIANIYWDLWNAGQAPLGWNPPNGYPDVAAAWLGAGAMIQRWNTHRALVHGWWGSLHYPTTLSLVPSGKTVTAEKWINAIAVRFVGNAPSPHHLAALLAAGDLKPNSPVPYEYLAGEIASLVLDSAYFQLR
jgi:uncharacterized protein (DUF1800 family)